MSRQFKRCLKLPPSTGFTEIWAFRSSSHLWRNTAGPEKQEGVSWFVSCVWYRYARCLLNRRHNALHSKYNDIMNHKDTIYGQNKQTNCITRTIVPTNTTWNVDLVSFSYKWNFHICFSKTFLRSTIHNSSNFLNRDNTWTFLQITMCICTHNWTPWSHVHFT